jgi:signal peptidase I
MPPREPEERPQDIDSNPLPEVRPRPVPLAFGRIEPAVEAWPVEQPPSQIWRRTRRIGWELVQTLVLAALIFFAVRAMAQNFRVEGSSMEPGLHHGQYLLVNKAIYAKINLRQLSKFIPFVDPGDNPERYLFRPPSRGDVVVFRFPGDPSRDFIKRVIGVPGDSVEVKAGQVFVNGVPLEEPYIKNHGRYDYELSYVPDGHYFVLGDNRSNSYDSHVWNFLPEENIIGRAMLSYWPLANFGGVGNRTIDLGFVKVPVPVPW